jgi:phage terminase large subunit-like protein
MDDFALSLLIEQRLERLQSTPDPLRVLFAEAEPEGPLWEYEHSHVGTYLPSRLHEKQAEAFHSEAKHTWLFWGNQVGKTTVGAISVAMLALGRHPTRQYWEPGLTIWASALTWELWENILLPELLTWIPPDRIIDAPPPFRQSSKRTIVVRADNGKVSRITGKAAEQGPGRYQSSRLHVFWGDEEHPEPIYDEVLPRLLRNGGISYWTMTPLKGLTWVYSRIYEPWKQNRVERGQHTCSHAGLVDNPSIRPEELESLRRELQHNPSLLAARFYGMFMRPQGLVLPYDAKKHLETIDASSMLVMRARGQFYGGIDFGAWRFTFLLGLVDRVGRMHILEEYFSQNESLDTRAKAIHDLLVANNVPRLVSIFGDCANPTDIREINEAFERIKSPYRVLPVSMEHKIRKAGVERLENMLNRLSLLFRRGIGSGKVWYLGQGASSDGKPVEGSRLLWELDNWRYPKAPDGKVQKDDPDDASADGGDMMAALRYLVMSWWAKASMPAEAPVDPWAKSTIKAEEEWQRYDNPTPERLGGRVGGSPIHGV